MTFYPNRERWFFNISSRNNRIIISDTLFFKFNRCSYFYFYGSMIFKPLLLREINMSSKRFTERSYYLRVKSIFTTKFMMRTSIPLLHPEPLLLHILDELLELAHAN